MWHVFNDIYDRIKRDPDLKIDDQLFEQIGKPLALGKTLTAEYYYKAKRLFGPFRKI